MVGEEHAVRTTKAAKEKEEEHEEEKEEGWGAGTDAAVAAAVTAVGKTGEYGQEGEASHGLGGGHRHMDPRSTCSRASDPKKRYPDIAIVTLEHGEAEAPRLRPTAQMRKGGPFSSSPPLLFVHRRLGAGATRIAAYCLW